MRQFELDFEGGLIDRFDEWEDCVRNSVSSCGKKQKSIAADLDMSPSELSRKLARRHPDKPDEPNFQWQRIPALIDATGNLDPIYWLIEKFCDGPEEKRRRAIESLAQMMPRLEKLMQEVKSKS